MHEKYNRANTEGLQYFPEANQHITPEDKLRWKLFYSQKTVPQSRERIIQAADEVIAKGETLKVKRNGETFTYDAMGRAVKVEDKTMTLKRKYNELGYIAEEVLSGIDENGDTIVEVGEFVYGYQLGKVSVEKIFVKPYKIVRLGEMEPIQEESVIDLRDIMPVLPIEQSKPSFT